MGNLFGTLPAAEVERVRNACVQREEETYHMRRADVETLRARRIQREEREEEAKRKRQAEEEALRALRVKCEAEAKRKRQAEEEEALRALRVKCEEEAKRRRQAEEERRRALRIQREEEAKRKRQAEEKRNRARRVQQARDELAVNVDLYIRTRRKFDTRDPLAYLCSVASISQDPDVQESLEGLNELCDTSLEEFVVEDARFVSNNDGTRVRVRYRTPFRGKHRVYGRFECGKCGRYWESAASWADVWQKCQGCESQIYPFEQRCLERSDRGDDELDSERPHDSLRCQKCAELGRICVQDT